MEQQPLPPAQEKETSRSSSTWQTFATERQPASPEGSRRMRRVRLGVLASGRGTNLQAIIAASQKEDYPAEVVVVLSDKPEAMALERARQHGIPAQVVPPREFGSRLRYEEALVRILRDYGVDLVVLAGYMRLVGREFLRAFPDRVMNIHPSLLPAFPGLEAQRQALEYGVKISGCTVHFVDAEMDHGPIILQAAVPVLDGDTVESLAERILAEEHRLYPEAIRLWAEGRLQIEGRRVRILA